MQIIYREGLRAVRTIHWVRAECTQKGCCEPYSSTDEEAVSLFAATHVRETGHPVAVDIQATVTFLPGEEKK